MAEKKNVIPEEAVREKEQVKAAEYYGEELVTRFYIKDNHRYKDDIYVAVGLDNCYVPRGKQVLIKKKFADIIDASMVQDSVADDYMRSYISNGDN